MLFRILLGLVVGLIMARPTPTGCGHATPTPTVPPVDPKPPVDPPATTAGCGMGIPPKPGTLPGNGVASILDQLKALMAQIQELLAGKGNDPVQKGGPIDIPPPGNVTTGFISRTSDELINNLQQSQVARNGRMRDIQAAINAENQANGVFNPLTLQGLEREKTTGAQVDRIIAALIPAKTKLTAIDLSKFDSAAAAATTSGSVAPLLGALADFAGSNKLASAEDVAAAKTAITEATALAAQLNTKAAEVYARQNATGSFDPLALQNLQLDGQRYDGLINQAFNSLGIV